MKPLVFAHRGARNVAPENTLEAFQIALDAGADGIELDVHRCATGELVVIHDEQVNRTTNGVGYVKDMSLAELERLDAGSWFDNEFAGARIPTLKQVLELVDGSAILNIEIKNTPIAYPGIEEDLVQILRDYSKDEVIISSFDHKLMMRYSRLDPSANLALLAAALFTDLSQYAAQFDAKHWHPCFGDLRQDSVEEAHEAGLKVNAWTVNSPRNWELAIRMQIDGIMTDEPVLLIDYLKSLQPMRALV